jgi:hypothetical protein
MHGHEASPLEKPQYPKATNVGAGAKIYEWVLQDVGFGMVVLHCYDSLVWKRIPHHVCDDLVVSYRRLYAMKMRQPPDNLSHSSKDTFISCWVDLVTFTL